MPKGKFDKYLKILLPMKDEFFSARRLLPVHYDISLKTAPHLGTVDVEALITVEVPPEPVPFLRLYLGLPGLTTVSLQQVLLGGHSAQYTYRSPRLTIMPPSLPRAGQRLVICVAYSAKPGAPKNYTGPRGSELNAEFLWLPLVGFPDRAFSAHGVTRVPVGEETAFLGKCLRRKEEDGWVVAEWETEAPITLPAFVSGPFSRFEGVAGDGTSAEAAGKTTVTVLVQHGYERSASRLVKDVAGAMATGTSWFGELPLTQVFVVQPRRREYGQYAHMPFVVLTRDDVLRDQDETKERRLFQAVAHELGHFWWGNIVRSNVLDEGWLSEGFADFAKILAVEQVFGLGARADLLSRMLEDLRKAGPGPALGEVKAGHPGQPAIVRRQGGLFLQAYRQRLGDEAAKRFFRALFARFQNGIITTAAFEEFALAEMPASGRPGMAEFLQRHLHDQVTYRVDNDGRVLA